jgi:hypothetical protein
MIQVGDDAASRPTRQQFKSAMHAASRPTGQQFNLAMMPQVVLRDVESSWQSSRSKVSMMPQSKAALSRKKDLVWSHTAFIAA